MDDGIKKGRFELTHAQESVLHELREQTDRGLGVLGGALVDEMLKIALTCLWRDHATGANLDAFNSLVGEAGALTMSAKINLAFMTHLVGPTMFSDLKSVNKLRNKFAHLVLAEDLNKVPSRMTFSTTFVNDTCASLKLVDLAPVIFNGEELAIENARDRYLATTMILYATFEIYAGNPTKDPKYIDTILKC